MSSTITCIESSDNCRGHRANLIYFKDENGDIIEWNIKENTMFVYMTSEELEAD